MTVYIYLVLDYDVQMLYTLIPISIGAVGGAVLRHYVATSSLLNFTLFGFSWGIVLCNVLGCFAMGAFVEAGGRIFEMTPTIRLLIATGFLGSFTTFSMFSLQTIDLVRSGDILPAISYVLISVCVSIIALYLGMQLVKVV